MIRSEKRDDFKFSYDCAINGAKDDRFAAESDQLTAPVVIETNESPFVVSDDEAQRNAKARKVWIILLIIGVCVVIYAFDYANSVNLLYLGPLAFICGSTLLCWLRKPAQRGILLRIGPCFGIRNN